MNLRSPRLFRASRLAFGLTATALALAAAPSARAQNDAPTLSATFETERTTVYENEQFPLTLVITASGVRLGKSQDLVNMPDTTVLQRTDFEELPMEHRREGERMLEVRRFRCYVTVPTSRVIRLAPVLRITVVERQRFLLGSAWVEQAHDLSVRPLTLTVQPLPAAGRPAAFSGAIGQFDFTAQVTPTNLAVGELVTLRLQVQGRGNLTGVQPPRLAPPGTDFKTYEPRRLAEADKPGTAVFEQVLVPQHATAATIPAIAFCYFDTGKGSYQTVTRGPFRLAFHAAQQPEEVARYRPTGAEGSTETGLAGILPGGRRARLPAASRTTLALMGYWLAGLVAVSALLTSRAHRLARLRVRLFAAALAAAMLAGLFVPYRLAAQRRLGDAPRTTLARAATARFAPARQAARNGEFAAGTAVEVHETWQGWVRVSSGTLRGWIPTEALQPAGPPPAQQQN